MHAGPALPACMRTLAPPAAAPVWCQLCPPSLPPPLTSAGRPCPPASPGHRSAAAGRAGGPSRGPGSRSAWSSGSGRSCHRRQADVASRQAPWGGASGGAGLFASAKSMAIFSRYSAACWRAAGGTAHVLPLLLLFVMPHTPALRPPSCPCAVGGGAAGGTAGRPSAGRPRERPDDLLPALMRAVQGAARKKKNEVSAGCLSSRWWWSGGCGAGSGEDTRLAFVQAAVCCCCCISCWISQHLPPAAPPCFPIHPSDCGRVHCCAPHPQGVQGLGAGCPEGACRAPGRQQGLGSQALWPRPAGRCRTGGGGSRGRNGGRGGGRGRCAGAHAWCCSCGRGGRGRRSGGSSSGWCGAHTSGCQARLWGSRHRAVLQEGEQPINAGQ